MKFSALPGKPNTREVSFEQAEGEHQVTVEIDGKSVTQPFGFMNADWLRLKNLYQPGDKLIEFTSSQESWAQMAGRAGYQLLRGSEILYTVITVMN